MKNKCVPFSVRLKLNNSAWLASGQQPHRKHQHERAQRASGYAVQSTSPQPAEHIRRTRF